MTKCDLCGDEVSVIEFHKFRVHFNWREYQDKKDED